MKNKCKQKSPESLDAFYAEQNKTLRESGIFHLTGGIDMSDAHQFSREIHYMIIKKKLPKTLTIVINSPGGSVYAGFSMMETIALLKKHKVKVIGKVTGMAASMAAVILSDCDERQITRWSRVMIHEVAEFKFLSYEKASQSEEGAIELNKVNDSIVEILAENTGKSFNDVKKTIKKTDYWMNAKEAKEFGIIDKVV